MLAAGLSCPPNKIVESPGPTTDNRIALFFTGDEMGALKPCGCSGGQLGGLEKRPAVFNTVDASKRVIVETGHLVESDAPQDLIKARIFYEAFRLIGYDVVHLTAQDSSIRDRLDLPQGSDYHYAIIAARWPGQAADQHRSFSKELMVEGRKVTVVVAAADAKADSADKAGEFWAAASGLAIKVLILENTDRGLLDDWMSRSGADCIVCPSRIDDPEVLSRPGTRPYVFSVGRFGRHVSRLDVTFSAPDERMEMKLTDIRVEEQLPNDAALGQLYKQYQMIVKDSRLLETYPRIPLPNYLQYVGSQSCESCHVYEYALWSTQAHASAFATLQKVGSDYDPECVICHVVGMDKEGGFVTPQATARLKNVGCEVCHGPGSDHVRAGGHVPTTEPKAACTQCHTPEHSSGYAGHEEEYKKKIVHWLEP